MQLGELLRKRLRIALGAVHNDPAVGDSLKSALSIVSECLGQQWAALGVAEAEIAGKVGEEELRGGLALKLSVREFLGYFQKIEGVVEKMEHYWTGSEAKTKDLIDHRFAALAQDVQDIALARANHLTQLSQLEQNALSETQQLRTELNLLRQHLAHTQKQLEANSESHAAQFSELSSRLNEGLSQQRQSLPNDKLKLVLSELREIQLFFNETHQQTSELMQEVLRSQSRPPPQPDPHSLAQIASLQQQLQQLPPPAHRLLWEWRPASGELRWQNAGGLAASEWGGAVARKAGVHKVAVGYLAEEGLNGQLVLVVDEQEVRMVELEEGQEECGLCRATMLFVYLREGSSVKLQLHTKRPLSGFLEVQHF